jgi:hypothetical protein
MVATHSSAIVRTSDFPYVYPAHDSSSLSILPLWLEMWFVFFLLYNNFIPLSLYVTIEIVNLGQALFISSDDQMYHPGLDVACTVRASNLGTVMMMMMSMMMVMMSMMMMSMMMVMMSMMSMMMVIRSERQMSLSIDRHHSFIASYLISSLPMLCCLISSHAILYYAI